MKTSARAQVATETSPTRAEVVLFEGLPATGAPTERALDKLVTRARNSAADEQAALTEELKGMVRALCLRGADEDLRALLTALESGRLEHLEDAEGGAIEVYAVHAMLASGNALALAIPPAVYSRYEDTLASHSWPKGLTRFGQAATGIGVLVAALFCLAFWGTGAAMTEAHSLTDAASTIPWFPLVFAAHVLVAAGGMAILESIRRPEKPRPVAAQTAAGGSLLLLVILLVMNAPEAVLALSVLTAAGSLSLIPRKKKIEM